MTNEIHLQVMCYMILLLCVYTKINTTALQQQCRSSVDLSWLLTIKNIEKIKGQICYQH